MPLAPIIIFKYNIHLRLFCNYLFMITNIFLVYLLRERRLLRDEASLSAYSAARRS